ncbi:hypothetical protein GOPIP_077_00110 [Gordonia polyisoprenivorans NBRC 16320 = JCM 10675]|uniref:Uncharacterized protein n=1 Tax=Gordonia polyisoprenivorans TaxID=84595 RepID=A0A846WKU0_9ACTN|nr:hypothetical protein [Gordonia polyisoprenivorans]NKY01849.1 hypothetical protein [Gordonia polyisoprenivorans]GAB25086.1 hypothetical protein GOPIP_077_00110 [Gordonia polyisoprenivorans NBRC 16320 = JCM 10675]
MSPDILAQDVGYMDDLFVAESPTNDAGLSDVAPVLRPPIELRQPRRFQQGLTEHEVGVARKSRRVEGESTPSAVKRADAPDRVQVSQRQRITTEHAPNQRFSAVPKDYLGGLGQFDECVRILEDAHHIDSRHLVTEQLGELPVDSPGPATGGDTRCLRAVLGHETSDRSGHLQGSVQWFCDRGMEYPPR